MGKYVEELLSAAEISRADAEVLARAAAKKKELEYQEHLDKVLIKEQHWGDIPGWEGRYAVSQGGYVLRKGRYSDATEGRAPKWLPDRIIRPTRSGRYAVVSLTRDGITTRAFLHKLQAEVFLGPCPEGKILRVPESYFRERSFSCLAYRDRVVKPRPPEQAAARAAARIAQRAEAKALRGALQRKAEAEREALVAELEATKDELEKLRRKHFVEVKPHA